MLLAVASIGMAASLPQSRPIRPEVGSDRTITFRLAAPNAQRVEVSLEGSGNLALAKGDDGLWTVTTKPLEPDLYGYTYSVDGVATLDPNNPRITPNLIWVGNLILVPGKPPAVWEARDVPRGELHQRFYKSAIIGDRRDYFVYTPPGYREGKSKLPVLYLLHGFSDTANGWTSVGNAHVILDNLLADGKIKPMVVVMPLGYGVPDFASPGGRAFDDRRLVTENFTKFRDALMKEVRPQVEAAYRVSTKREDRAIAGLSMGGAESLFVGLANLDAFGAVGAFSAGGLPATRPEEAFPDLDAKKANSLKVFWMACGTGDSLIGFQRGFAAWLKEKGVRVLTKETPGGHEWRLWRRYLAEFAAKLFR